MSTVETRTAELIGPALDWAVAHAVKAWESAHELFPTMTLDPTFSGVEARPYPRGEFGAMLMTCVLVPRNPFRQDPQAFCPSTIWEHGGPLIQKYGCDLNCIAPANCWEANCWDDRLPTPGLHLQEAETPLTAACRAIVAAKLGDTVQVPEELLP